MPLREPNEERQRAIEMLIAKASRMERGEILRHRDIAKIAGVPYGTPAYYSICDSFKRRTEKDLHITLIAATSLGYRLLSVDDQIHEAPAMRSKRARVQINKAGRAVRVLLTEDIPLHQKQAATLQLDGIRGVHRNLLAHSMALKAATAGENAAVVPPQFRATAG